MYLFTPDSYFYERTNVPFIYAIIVVFVYSGANLISTIISFATVFSGGTTPDSVSISGLTLMYSLSTGVLAWLLIGMIFYGVILWYGETTIDLYTSINAVGISIAPIAIVSFIDMVVTFYLSITGGNPGLTTITFSVLGGEYGIIPALALFLLYIGSIVWTAYIWSSYLNKMGDVKRKKAKIVSGATGSVILLQYIILALA